MGWITQHKLIFIGIIVVVVGGIWYGLSQSSAPKNPSLVTSVTSSNGSPTQESADQELVATLLTLRSVTLTGTIFQDPTFTSLRDFGTEILREPVGRDNPFAPLEKPAQNVAAAAATTITAPPVQARTTKKP